MRLSKNIKRHIPQLSAIAFILLLHLFFINQLQAADAASKEPNVLIFTSVESEIESVHQDINTIESTMLSDVELNSIQIEDDVSIEELLDKAGWLGAFFIIETIFKDSPDGSILEMSCYAAWNRQHLISLYFENENAKALEDRIRFSMNKIIEVIKTNLELVKASPPPGWDWWKQDPEKTEETEESESIEKIDLPDDIEEVEKTETKENLTEIQEIPAPLVPREKAESPLIFSLTGAPVISTFEASDYFSIASHISLSGSYKLFQRPFILSLGGRFSWDNINAEGVLISAGIDLFYLGPEVMLGYAFKKGGWAFLKFSPGISFMNLESDIIGISTSILPYFSIGMGAAIPVTERFGAYYSGDYNLHIEKSVIISGFYPSLGIYLNVDLKK